MAYGLTSQTYNYETLLNILKNNPGGLSVSQMKRDYGVHKDFDIKGLMRSKGIDTLVKNDKEPHFISTLTSKTSAINVITKAGKDYLKKNTRYIQDPIEDVKLYWKEGFGPDGEAPVKKVKRAEQQTVLPLEQPIILSNTAQKAADLLNQAISSNHSAKTAIEEVHVLIAKYFESNQLDDRLKKESGIIGEVVAEALTFREVLEQITEATTESLLADEEETA